MAYVVVAHTVMAYIVMAHIVTAYVRARTYLPVTVAYGTCTMHVWLATTCPQTLIMTLGDVLESGNAKNCVNLTCSVCVRYGDEVLCGAENAVFGRVQMSACERAKNCAQMDPNRLTCLIGHGNRSLTSKIGSLLPSRSSAAARLLARSMCTLPHALPRARSHVHAHANAIGSKLSSDARLYG